MLNVEQPCTTDHMAKKEAWIGLRVTEIEHDAWKRAAEVDGRSLSSWIVRRCNGLPATGPVFEPTPPTPPRPRRKRKE